MKRVLSIILSIISILSSIFALGCEPEQVEVNPCENGHTPIYIITLEASCTREGTRKQICSVCEKILIQNESIKKTDHVFEDSECVECGTSEEEYLILSSGLEFMINDEGTGYYFVGIENSKSKQEPHIIIPDYYRGLPVMYINERALYQVYWMKKLTFGANIKFIGFEAVNFCTGLEEVNFLGTVDQWAQIEFENSISTPMLYANKLYMNGVLIKDVNLTTATKISDYAFYNCQMIETVSIPKSVQSIGKNAFNYCRNLKSVTIEEGSTLETISGCAFDSCVSLKNINVEDAQLLQTIDYQAFYNCKLLTSFTISESVNFIGLKAFYLCENLNEIIFINPVGWVVRDEPDSATLLSVSKDNLMDAKTSATMLVSSHYYTIWNRK